MFPDDLSGPAIETLEDAAQTEHEDGVGLRVADDAGPAYAFSRRVREIDIVDAFPDEVSGFGIDTDRFFTLLIGLRERAANNVDAVIEHNRGGSRSKLGLVPKEVFTFGRPFFRKSGFERVAVVVGTPPVGPVIGVSRGTAEDSAAAE
jgi:hypothetical protein